MVWNSRRLIICKIVNMLRSKIHANIFSENINALSSHRQRTTWNWADVMQCIYYFVWRCEFALLKEILYSCEEMKTIFAIWTGFRDLTHTPLCAIVFNLYLYVFSRTFQYRNEAYCFSLAKQRSIHAETAWSICARIN